MSEDTKLVVLESGGDWYDASYYIVTVPKNLDLKEAKKEYVEWRKSVTFNERLMFTEWLKRKKGAVEVNLEVFEI